MLKNYLKRFKMPVLRIICFMIILFLLADKAQYYLQYRERYNDNSSFQIINFYKEEKNSDGFCLKKASEKVRKMA